MRSSSISFAVIESLHMECRIPKVLVLWSALIKQTSFNNQVLASKRRGSFTKVLPRFLRFIKLQPKFKERKNLENLNQAALSKIEDNVILSK